MDDGTLYFQMIIIALVLAWMFIPLKKSENEPTTRNYWTNMNLCDEYTEEIQKVNNLKEEKKQEITENNIEEQEIESEKAIEKVDIVENAEIKAPTYIRPQPIKKQAIFDQSKDFIFLESKNSWPSELRNYILNSAYNAKAIGTYAYTQQEDKKEFLGV